MRIVGLLILFCPLLCGCSSGEGSRGINHQVTDTTSNDVVNGTTAPGEFVVFVYHRFGDPKHLSTNINLEDFRRQMEYLKNAGFEVVTLGDALNKTGDQKRAVITVDDAYTSFLEGAVPVLNDFDFPVTLFVNTETVGGEDYLSWDQLDSLRKQGVEIGNHSHSHAYFLNMPEANYVEKFRADVSRAQDLFEENLGFRPDLFAYPYGEFDTRLQEEVRSMGFRAAAAQNSGVVLTGQDTWALPRFPVSDAYSDIESFKDKANARALHVTHESPVSPRISANQSPVWKLITAQRLARGQIQCFVQGGFCQMNTSGDTLIVSSENGLNSRRTIYTVTMPDGNGRWYWRSHLWVNPK